MELDFQVLDCDYFMNGDRPVLRFFGRTEEGKSVCAFYEGFLPYFYVLLQDNNKTEEFIDYLNKTFPGTLVDVEFVKRFLPIGYHKEKSDVLKITISDPSKVPLLRDDIIKNGLVKEVFEADILFKYRFMVDKNIFGMKTVKAIGDSATTSIVKTDYKITATSIEPVEQTFTPKLKYLALDIEVVGQNEGLPDARRDEVAMISMAFHPKHNGQESMVFLVKPVKTDDKSVQSFTNEKAMLEEFLKVISSFDPDVLIGYNINGFDFPYLLERYKQCNVPCIMGRCSTKPAVSRKFGMWYRSTATGRVIVDAYNLIKESASKGLMRLKRYGLGDVSKFLLNQDKVDISHSQISKYWNGDASKVEKLIKYSRIDSVLALNLVLKKNLLDKFLELSKVSGVLLPDVLSSGESIRVETLLLREFNKLGFVIPCKPSDEEIARRNLERETKFLKGALVLEPESGLHTDVVIYLDFKSMYPSIYISYNICPTTIIRDEKVEDKIDTPYGASFTSKSVRKGIIPDIVESLINERDIVKKEMRGETDGNKIRELNAKQLALKIMANAFYGYTGYTRAKIYVLDIANAITSCGRYLIQKTRDTVDSLGSYKVIYGDTDSVMVKTKTKDLDEAYSMGLDLEKKINKELEGIVKIKIENLFKSILILTKKRYAGWSFEKKGDGWDEQIAMKGIETVRRDWCDLVSNTLFDVLEIVLKDQDPKKAFDYVRGVLRKLQKNEIDIDRLVVTKSISKPVKSYKGIQPHIEVMKKMRKRNPSDAPGVGDRIGFVIVQGLQLLSNRAEDPEYVKEHGLKIDSKYYIENQLLPPLERVFESMGIDKSELLGVGRQTLLTSLFGNSAKKNGGIIEYPEGVMCEKCGKSYSMMPLVGKCENCGGGLVFYKGDQKSKECLISR